MKNKNDKLYNDSTILIRPSGAGKSTIAQILSKQTGLPRLCLDKIANNDRRSGVMDFFKNSDEYNYYMISSILDEAESQSEDVAGIVDFGAGHSVYDDPKIFSDLKKRLCKFKNIVLLLPSVKIEESLEIMSKRSTRDTRENKKFLTSPCNRDLATIVIYCNNRFPIDIANEILHTIYKRKNNEEKLR